MTDTLYPCLIDVTNNNTEATSQVHSTKDGSLSSQDDSDQIPQLSSPSTTSTISSPSSSLIEVTLVTCGKRSYDTISSTPLSLDVIENEENSNSTTSTKGESKEHILEATEMAGSLERQLLGPPRHQFNKKGSLKKIAIPGECLDLDHNKPSEHLLDSRKSKRRRLQTHLLHDQDPISFNATVNSPDSPTKCTSSILLSTPLLSRSTSPRPAALIRTPLEENENEEDEGCPTVNEDPALSSDSKEIAKAVSSPTLKTCLQCKSSRTMMWRKGPEGKNTLCNACGLRYSKFQRGARSSWKASPSTNQTTPRKDPTKKTPNHDIDSPKKAIPSSRTVKAKKLNKDDSLRAKKVYLKAGMHSGGSNHHQLGKGIADPPRFSFPLPLHQGAILMEEEKDFKLPLDIRQDYESGRLFGWTNYSSSKKPPRYIRVHQNTYVERKARKENQNTTCICIPKKDGHGCGEDCLNRMMFIECDSSTCPCGDQCSNQKFKKRQFIKSLKVYLTDGRGWGICTKDDIPQGTLITEYRGEIISDKTCQERIRTVYKHQKNFYFLDYHKGEVIDACSKGSEARFINHGCDPNCHIEKWSRGGEYHLGVFASKDIPAGSELFYDYNFSLFDTEAIGQECRCGSANCRGFLGKRPGQSKK